MLSFDPRWAVLTFSGALAAACVAPERSAPVNPPPVNPVVVGVEKSPEVAPVETAPSSAAQPAPRPLASGRVELNAAALALPPHACRVERDCDQKAPHCFLQVGPVCGGAAIRPCDCREGMVAEGDACGRCRCVPDCRGQTVRAGERAGQECDRQTGAWRPVRCDKGAGCDPLFVCAPRHEEADAAGCVRRTCKSDLQCPRGTPCFSGRCMGAFGRCMAELPSPPP